MILTSVANPTVKHLVRMRENRPRRRAGEVLTDGPRQTAMALAAGHPLRGLFVAETTGDRVLALIDSEYRKIPDTMDFPAERAQGLIREVTTTVMEKIAYGQTAADVVGQFQWKAKTLDDLELSETAFILVLDRIEKPGNVGAIFRTADAVGIDAVLLCGGGDPTHPNAIRNSQGAVFSTDSVACDWHAAQQWLASGGVSMLAARVESSDALYEAQWDGPLAIILGNEADGLGERWAAESGVRGIHIPMAGSVDSLNVAVSASLLMYEAFRRRRFG